MTISNNHITNWGRTAIEVHSFLAGYISGINVHGNQINHCYYGIIFSHVRDSSATDDVIINSERAAIQLDTSVRLNIQPSMIINGSGADFKAAIRLFATNYTLVSGYVSALDGLMTYSVAEQNGADYNRILNVVAWNKPIVVIGANTIVSNCQNVTSWIT
jgi:hypothetical protein